MTGINSYSTNPDNNVLANTGIDWNEGMAPAAVNNSARQNMADSRAAFNDLAWFQYGIGDGGVAPAYASSTSFTLAGADVTAVWHAGRRVKAMGSATGTIYGSIAASTYAASTTTVNVTWDSGSLHNESLAIYLSQLPVTGSPVAQGSVVGLSALSGRNRLINGDFRINQRLYVSGATLASGTYAHDRWKAGANGGDYSFTQAKSDTTITIASGKSLMQVVEDVNVEGGSYVLSWSGTAQGRAATGGTTPSNAYAASPVYVTGAAAGQTITVEFNAGTLGKVQLEPGPVATQFERVTFSKALSDCQRYFESSWPVGTAIGTAISYPGYEAWAMAFGYGNFAGPSGHKFIVEKRTIPTLALYSTDGTLGKIYLYASGTNSYSLAFANTKVITGLSTGYNNNQAILFGYTADAEI